MDACLSTFPDHMFQDSGRLPDDSQLFVTRRAQHFWLLIIECVCSPEEVNTILSREHEAAEFTSQAHDFSGLREEEQRESDFVSDRSDGDESEDHPSRGFWVCAYPLANN